MKTKILLFVVLSCISCKAEMKGDNASSDKQQDTIVSAVESTPGVSDEANASSEENNADDKSAVKTITWNKGWKYADKAVIFSSSVNLYRASSNRKNKVVAVNAGHGTKGGQAKKVLCHPDGSPKCVSGSTAAGATKAAAVGGGMVFLNKTGEATATLKVALKLKDMLLAEGYDVLMIRETEDCQLDNIARTVFANNNADIHIAIHFDGSKNDKGAFYVGVPNIASYRKMEPVASHWQQHEALGKALNSGMRKAGVKVWSSGNMPIDLTQTSFSTIPSVDYETGDAATDISDAGIKKMAQGYLEGIKIYFGNK